MHLCGIPRQLQSTILSVLTENFRKRRFKRRCENVLNMPNHLPVAVFFIRLRQVGASQIYANICQLNQSAVHSFTNRSDHCEIITHTACNLKTDSQRKNLTSINTKLTFYLPFLTIYYYLPFCISAY